MIRARRTSRGGFVMPMVILLMVVVGLTLGMVLSRHSAEQLLVTRQVNAYTEHHAGRGLQEAIGAWLRMQNGREISEVLDPDTGHAMDILLRDGSVVSVSLIDAQGTMLSDLTNQGEAQIAIGEPALEVLRETVSPAAYQKLTRPYGPIGVSAKTSSIEVLRAAGLAVSADRGVRLADEIALLQRSDEEINRTKLVEVATRAGLTSEQRGSMLRIITTDIQIWGVVVEVRGGSGLSKGRLLKRYGGITRIRTSTGRASASNVMEIGSFYTWKDLGIDSEMVDPTDLY